MQKLEFWYLQHLRRNKITVLLVLCTLLTSGLKAQFRESLNLPDHDSKPYYFGIVLGYNTSHYNVSLNHQYLEQDTVLTVNSQNSGRIHLGIMANFQLNDRWDIRFYPLNLIFSEKRFIYTLKFADPGEPALVQDKKVESIVMSFPLQVRLKSDRINNFRVYTLGGIKYDYDLASNAGSTNTGDNLKVKKGDFGIEAGIGFQFFFKYFILAPEIKVSNGITNVLVRDPTNKFSNVIDKMYSRMILFSLHFEGGGGN